MRIKSSKKKLSHRRMVIALDKAARKEVVEDRDDNTCQRCGHKQGQWDEEIKMPVVIQWAHVHGRDDFALRWEPDNTIALCSRCHVFFDNHKVLAFEWFRKRWPERWEHLQNVLQFQPRCVAKVRVKDLYGELTLPAHKAVKYMPIPPEMPF